MSSLGGLFIGFLTAVLYCAIVILIAWAFVWVMRAVFGVSIDANVMHWGKIVIALICAIILIGWLFGALGVVGSTPFPRLSGAGAYLAAG